MFSLALLRNILVGASAVISAVVSFVAYQRYKNSEELIKQDLKSKKNMELSIDHTTAKENFLADRKIVEQVKAREKAEEREKINKWKQTTNYSKIVSDLTKQPIEQVKLFKKEIGYDAQVAELKRSFNAAVAELDKRLGYSKQKSDLERELRSEKDKLDSAKFTINLMSDDEEAKAARVQMETKLYSKKKKELDAKLDELNREWKTESKGLQDKYNASVKSLDEQVSAVESDWMTKTAKAVSEYTEKLNARQTSIREEILEKRSEAEKNAFCSYETTQRIYKNFESISEQEIEQEIASMSVTEKIARSFKYSGLKSADIALLATFPTILLGYVCYKYIMFITTIISFM